jgi:hypothetical protein
MRAGSMQVQIVDCRLRVLRGDAISPRRHGDTEENLEENPKATEFVTAVGVLRLRGKCAPRNFHCAQDDRETYDSVWVTGY